MKKINLLALVLAAIMLSVASCKKDDDNGNNNNNNNNNNDTIQSNPLSQQLGGSANIPSDAAGAFYSVDNVVISDDFGTPDTSSIGFGFAWFDNYTATKNGGDVTCQGSLLDITNPFNNAQTLAWYYTISNYIFYDQSVAAVDWNVTGNTANSVPAFSYTDPTPFPGINWFNIPATINTNNSLTINWTNTNTNDGVFFTVAGDKGKFTKAGAANATSVTFTSAELKQAAYDGGYQIGIQVMPVKISSHTVSGKKYYFVKQRAFAKGAVTQ